MTATTSARLADQRALSAGTTQRFALLLILFLVSGVQLASSVFLDSPLVPYDASAGCFLAAGINPSASGIALIGPEIREQVALNACRARYGWNPPWWPPYAITAGLVAIAVLIYLLFAAGRRRAVQVTGVDPGGELAVELRALSARAGLARPPRFVVDPAAITASAVAFGLPGWHTVCLHGGLVAQFRSDPEGFRAVVLHELAHIKNRDIGIRHAMTATISVLIYLLFAAGRRRAVQVTGVDPGGELAVELRALSARAGLARPPRFVVDPAAITASAVAFGLPGWHTVCLHGGLVAQFRSDPEGFRAVVLHELAHIKNRDIGITYATIAAWRVYLVTLLLLATVSSAWQLLSGPTGIGMGAGTQLFWPAVRTEQLKSLAVMAFLVLLVYLARADVMRARETYADLDAAIWTVRTAASRGNGKQPGPLSAFWQLWRTHPTPRQRAEVLADASAVFRISSLQMFLTGAAAVVILYWFQGDLSPLSGTLGGPQYWPGAVASALITSVVGVALWRAAANAVLTVGPAPAGLRAGLWLGIGLMAGDLMGGWASYHHWLPAEPVFLLALLLFAAVATTWTAEFAALCVAAWHGRGKGLVMVAGLGVIGAAVAIWLAWWYGEGELSALGFPLTSDGMLQVLVGGPPGKVIPEHHGLLLAIVAVINPSFSAGEWLFAVAAALLWVAPLLTWAHRTRVGSPRLRSVLLAGLGGGAVCWAGAIAVMAYLHSWPIPADRSLLQSYLLIFFGCLAACIAAGMVAAAVAAALMQGLQLLAAMVAAGTASLAGLAGVYLFISGDGCVAPLGTFAKSCAWHPDVAWGFVQTFGMLALSVGTAAAAVAALLILTAVTVAARRRARSASTAPDQAGLPVQAWGGSRASVGNMPVKRTVIVVLTAAAITMLAVGFSSPGANLPGGQGSGTTADASAESQLLPEATYSASPRTTGVMVAAWLHYGGLQQITILGEDFTRLSGAFNASFAKMQRETSKPGLILVTPAQARSALAPTVAACVAIMAVARSAETYFPVPITGLQPQWQSALAGISAGARGCTEGASKANAAQLLGSIQGMTQEGETLLGLAAKLKSAAGRLCRIRC